METENLLSLTTRQLYERNMRTLVMPAFTDLTLREIGVARCDYFLKQLTNQSYNRARQASVALRRTLGLAVLREAIPRNPMDHVSRLRRPARTVDTFDDADTALIRDAVQEWESRDVTAGPRPDGQLGQIVKVFLGTFMRIGEVLALRLRDLTLRGAVPTVRVCGTIVSRKSEPTHQQDHPKTSQSVRTIVLPKFVVDAIRLRIRARSSIDPDALLFYTRKGGALTTNNVRRRLRDVMDKAGMEGVTPHRFRRPDPRITAQHYTVRNDLVNPTMASVLEARFDDRS